MAWGPLRAKILVSLFALLITVGIVFPVLGQRGGLISNDERAYPGYTSLAPISSTTTYLIDMNGEVVHTWDSDATAGNAVYLLENGHLLRTENLVPSAERRFGRGGAGGRVREIAWDGTVVWEFIYSDSEHLSHHDVTVLPNGNTLICSGVNGRLFEVTPEGEIVWEYINPFVTRTPDGQRNEVFKVRRYALDHAGLVNLGKSPSPPDWILHNSRPSMR